MAYNRTTWVGGDLITATKLNKLENQVASNTDLLEQKIDSSGTIDNAKQLISTVTETDKVPYNFRASGNNLDIGNRMDDKIIGGTLVWNQMLDPTINIELDMNNDQRVTTTIVPSGSRVINNHIYLYSIKISNINNISYSVNSGLYTSTDGSTTKVIANLQTLTNGYVAKVFKSSYSAISDGSVTGLGHLWQYSFMNANDTTGSVELSNTNLIDLTQMFGATIAEYIYSLETSTSGAGVTWFRNLFPKDYYNYNSGTLMSVNTSAHITRDSSNNIIGNYPLDSTLTLYGVPKLDSNNKLYYDGDIYESNGTVTRKYGIIDLGTLEWSYNSTAEVFTSPATTLNLKKIAMPDLINIKYTPVSGSVNISDIGEYADKTICAHIPSNNFNLVIKDTAYNNAATFKTSLNGVYLVYELAESTTETATPYQNPQIVDKLGTEQYIDYAYSQGTRDVAIPVGHETQYMADLRDKLQNLPDLAATNGQYIISQSDNQMTLAPYNGVVEETVSDTTPSITAVANHRYICGEVSTLSITTPVSGCIDVMFMSGSTPTVLTITPPTGLTMKWANGFDPTSLEADTVYEISIMDGIYGVVCSWT